MPRAYRGGNAVLRGSGRNGFLQGRVAFEAARERTGVRGESEAPEDLDRLVLGRERMHEAALGDVPALEQFAVPGEHDALLAHGRGNERGVLDAVVVEGVEAGQAQKACEAAEMGVGDEAWGQ